MGAISHLSQEFERNVCVSAIFFVLLQRIIIKGESDMELQTVKIGRENTWLRRYVTKTELCLSILFSFPYPPTRAFANTRFFCVTQIDTSQAQKCPVYRGFRRLVFCEMLKPPKSGNEAQNNTLNYVKSHPGCKANEISLELNIPFSTIDKHIRVLLKYNMIERRGSKKTGGYYAIK